MNHTKITYRNWVPRKALLVAAVYAVAGVAVALTPVPWWLALIHWVLAVTAIGVLLFFTYCYWVFSPAGADLQEGVWAALRARLPELPRGRVLDVGTGDGPVAITLAKMSDEAAITGVDRWGGLWGTSRRRCLANAHAAGVGANVQFRRAVAGDLPFADGQFDLLVSNLVFHEVRGHGAPVAALQEALRVLRKGGQFVFQDLFLDEDLYGPAEELLRRIRSWGVQEVRLEDTAAELPIPPLLRIRLMLGGLAVVRGTK